MATRFTRCDSRKLKQAVYDRLPESSHSDLADHLQTCDFCRAELETLAGGAAWFDEVRLCLRAESSDLASAPSGYTSSAPVLRGSDSFESKSDIRRRELSFLSPSDVPGDLGSLGPYRITEVIGRGGMGIVLKAFDAPLNRFVAIKALAAEWAHSAAARRRFAREAQAAAAVVHDHVVPIYAVDGASDIPYLVMAHIPGCSLQERLDRSGALELKEVLRIGMQVALGLAAAHAQGLVHRDIKPANILLENGIERVRITDFGLARAIDDASQTQSGFLAGTPQYMSPEQAAGEALDHRTDLFSLGSVLYALCVGHPPFRAPTTIAVLRRICDGVPRPIQEIDPEIPDWFADALERLHAKRPADRFQSAREVADLLERQLARLQRPGGENHSWLPGRRWYRRQLSRSKIILYGLLSLGAVFGGIWIAHDWYGLGAGKSAIHANKPQGPTKAGLRPPALTAENAAKTAASANLTEQFAFGSWSSELRQIEGRVERLEAGFQPASESGSDFSSELQNVQSELDALEQPEGFTESVIRQQ